MHPPHLMRRRAVYAILVFCLPAVAGSAIADRAVAPTDQLQSGTVTFDTSFSTLGRRLSLVDDQSAPNTRRLNSRTTDFDIAAGVWFSSELRLGARIGRSLFRSASDDGMSVDVGDERGFRDASIDLAWITARGPMRFGATGTIVFPTGAAGFSKDRTDIDATGLVGRRLSPSTEAFSLAGYTRRSGDDRTDIADEAHVSAGLNFRRSELSVVPTVSARRTFAIAGTAEQRGFTTVETRILLGYEPGPGFTGFVSGRYSYATNHDVGSMRLSGSEAQFVGGISYAWDTTTVAAYGGELPDPSIIAVSTASAMAADDDKAIRATVPALRRSTLETERSGGGALGTAEVVLTVAPDGTITNAVVNADAQLGTAMESAIRRFYLGARLPKNIASPVDFSLTFR